MEFSVPTHEDTDNDDITSVTYWLQDAGGTQYGKEEKADISKLNGGAIEFSNFDELKNKKLTLVWKVHTQYGYPSETLVSDEMTSNEFNVAAEMDLSISGVYEVGETLTVHAFDGADVDLNIADVTFTLAEMRPVTQRSIPNGASRSGSTK